MSEQIKDDEDDKPTVVLDFNALKKKAAAHEDLSEIDIEFNVQKEERPKTEEILEKTLVILFDYQSTFFKESLSLLPAGFDYQIATDLAGLNKLLQLKKPSLALFNYDAQSKAVNQLTAQIKAKFPLTKTMIIAKSISPEKALKHAATASGAHAYFKLPLDAGRLMAEFHKLIGLQKAS